MLLSWHPCPHREKSEQTLVLKLEKQKVATLSSSEMSQVNGGGFNRSRKNHGGCDFSRRRPAKSTDTTGEVHTTGCNPNGRAGSTGADGARGADGMN